jgi:hypothetical protein
MAVVRAMTRIDSGCTMLSCAIISSVSPSLK